MKIEEMKKIVSDIMHAKQQYGLTAFACLKHDKEYIIKKFKMNDYLHDDVKSVLCGVVDRHYLADDVDLDIADNIDDNCNTLYEVIQHEDYAPFKFLNEAENVVSEFSEEDLESMKGFVFRVNLNSKHIWFYQHVYQVRMIKRSKSLYAMLSGKNTYIPLDRPVLKIDARIDVLIIDNSIITSNIKLIQNEFGFDNYIRKEAQKAIEKINTLGIVSDISKIIAYEDKESLSNAKKLLKAKHSPVLDMTREHLIAGLKNLPRYKNKFRFDGDRIVINSQKDVGNLIKMLNDSIVRSELTGVEYDSTNKNILPPIESA